MNNENLKLNENNNIWLFFYRYFVGDYDAYPNLCPLVWKGSIGLILMVLSPFTVIYHIIYNKTKNKNTSFLKYLWKKDLHAVNLFWLNAGLIMIYLMMVFISCTDDGVVAANFLYLWLIPLILIATFIGICIGVIYLSDEIKKTKRPKFKLNDNLIVVKEAINSKYHKYCPKIEWVKK